MQRRIHPGYVAPGIVVVDPALVVGDAQNAARRRQRLIGDSRQRLHRSAGRHRQPLIVLNKRQRNIGAEQFDFGHFAQRRSAGAQGLERDRAAVPIQQRGIDVAVVARVANGIEFS